METRFPEELKEPSRESARKYHEIIPPFSADASLISLYLSYTLEQHCLAAFPRTGARALGCLAGGGSSRRFFRFYFFRNFPWFSVLFSQICLSSFPSLS